MVSKLQSYSLRASEDVVANLVMQELGPSRDIVMPPHQDLQCQQVKTEDSKQTKAPRREGTLAYAHHEAFGT